MEIKFGTSGWRGIISDTFTFANVRLVVRAIAEVVIASGEKDKGIVVSSDTRFLSERFVRCAAEILSSYDIPVFVPDRDTPTPVLSWDVICNKRAGAINFTASHNPAEYSGIKFSPSSGGPALPETTSRIEEKIQALQGSDWDGKVKEELIKTVDVKTNYFVQIEKLVDFSILQKCKGRVAVDVLYGTARGYIDVLLKKAGCEFDMLHKELNPLFGGNNPTPEGKSIQELIDKVKANDDIILGLAMDGDADRFGIIDRDGTFINPNQVLSVLFYYLLKTREKGGIAKSVTTTNMLNAISKKYDVELYETAVGFKYLGNLLIKENILLCGEESGGLSIKGHIPEKDGIIACLLVLEMVIKEQKTVKEIMDDIIKEVGNYNSSRIDLHISEEAKKEVMEKAKDIEEVCGKKVKEKIFKDGVKLVFEDESWIAMRPSGTEPIVRYYMEAGSVSDLEKFKEFGEKDLLGKLM